MPIFRINQKLVYFAHVPKCAGSAITRYLTEEIGPLAFHDSRFYSDPGKRWSTTSPQHITTDALARLFPDSFFDESFAIVRHPADRITSVFRFQRDIEAKIPIDMPFSDWLATLKPSKPLYDNHIRPMDDFIPKDTRIYRLEDGLAPLVNWLQQLAGPRITLPDTVTPHNVLSARLAHEGRPNKPVVTTADDLKKIAKLYKADYTRFGYDPEKDS